MNFKIDEAYLTSVTVREEHRPKFDNTEEGLIKALQYECNSYSIKNIDHPEFTELREQLGQQGYISIQRGWWNGDSVLKKFTLNGKKFKVGDQFPCGAAMIGYLQFMKR